MTRVAVIIPTYNERENIRSLVLRLIDVLRDTDVEYHILVVDDNSPDGTAEIVKGLSQDVAGVSLLSRPEKMGLGSAYGDGFRWCLTNIKPEVLIQMDADFSHPPEALPSLMSATKGYDVVIGSRYIKGGGVEAWAWHRRLISRAANWISRRVLGLKVKDVTSGLRGLSRAAVEGLLAHQLSSAGYVFQVETLYLFSRLGLKTTEVPFLYRARRAGATKLSPMEVLRFLRAILHLRLAAARIRR